MTSTSTDIAAVFDDTALQTALAGCDVGYYSVLDARMWLRDPAPLLRNNVDGLRHVLDAAVGAGLTKFVYTRTTGTLAISDGMPVTEADPHNGNQGAAYIESRRAAEELVLQYCRGMGLPAVALCVSTTYGPGDWAPIPARIADRARGRGQVPVLP
jgi:nucleoside-diphosphate-sugar epimerase